MNHDLCCTFQHSHVESRDSVSRTVAASDEDISGLGNSADDEASSWQSRLSVKTNDSQDVGEEEGEKDLDGDASSCVLQFKCVWFNFAAPPPSPKKRKLEFTRQVTMVLKYNFCHRHKLGMDSETSNSPKPSSKQGNDIRNVEVTINYCLHV